MRRVDPTNEKRTVPDGASVMLTGAGAFRDHSKFKTPNEDSEVTLSVSKR